MALGDKRPVVMAAEIAAAGGVAAQDEICAVEAGSTAASAHAAGTYISWNGLFYRVTAAIAAGDTLAAGTNLEVTTVGEVLEAVNASLAQKAENISVLQNAVKNDNKVIYINPGYTDNELNDYHYRTIAEAVARANGVLGWSRLNIKLQINVEHTINKLIVFKGDILSLESNTDSAAIVNLYDGAGIHLYGGATTIGLYAVTFNCYNTSELNIFHTNMGAVFFKIGGYRGCSVIPLTNANVNFIYCDNATVDFGIIPANRSPFIAFWARGLSLNLTNETYTGVLNLLKWIAYGEPVTLLKLISLTLGTNAYLCNGTNNNSRLLTGVPYGGNPASDTQAGNRLYSLN